jgi:hypothetical protein
LLVVLVALPASSRTGRAATGDAEKTEASACLSWVAAAGCPSAVETEAAVDEILGRRTFVTQSCDLDVRGEMRRLEHAGWQASLRFAKTNGESLGDRSLQSTAASCAALKGPVALAISMMVETGEAEATLQVPTGESVPGSEDRLSVAFATSSGILPKLGYGATAAYVSHPTTWLPLQLDATFWFPQTTTDQIDLGGQFWAWHAGASYCPTLLEGSGVEATACVGLDVGVIHGTGVGVPYVGSPTKPYGDVNARVGLSVPLVGPLEARLQLGVGTPWVRARFVYTDTAEASVPVHRPSAVVFFASVGLGLRASGRGGATSP